GFSSSTIAVGDLRFFVRAGGSGPPLLCLHGYPETHACWHRVAPELAKSHTVIAMDLRGYGQSSAPTSTGDNHVQYSKRTMAADCVAVMQALGYDKFSVMGHDRGARVAYRLALDHSAVLDKLVILDILPTVEVWDALRAESALKSYHWAFLAQPAPMPETMISADPEFYIDHTLRSWTQDRSLERLDPGALAHYRSFICERPRIHAICEDYRAGATFDRAADAQDRDDGRKIEAPTLLLWGADYLGKGASNPLEVWQRWCTTLEGCEINSGHFLMEENPADTLSAVLPFLARPA
ncbi:MAG TPA: alpha/beta hydrolase, partial [Hyphomicrobiaceae bacterium]|nr:alpha/beta hydrolase [Hyphomicrobiaceae bacterium]